MNYTSKGKLKIFTSYTPGAGKSYAMLSHALKNGNVIIGFLNDSHRNTNQLLLDHGIKPADYSTYSLREIIKENPDVVVMDEMGMRGKNRDRKSYIYSDIDRLLRCGIDVYTSLNIKRFESANPLFKDITGIGIRRTVPDKYLELADEIIFVDRSPKTMLDDFKNNGLFDEKYMKSKIMRKNFRIETLEAYRTISLEILEKYKKKTKIEKR